MEYLDILNEDGTPSGKTEERQKIHLEGLFHRVVHVWIVNNDNELLLQRRSGNKYSYANMWCISAEGHASAGKTSLEAAIAETSEEIGVNLKNNELTFVYSYRVYRKTERGFISNHLVDVYLVRKNIDISNIVIQAEEVSDAKWMALGEYKENIKSSNPEYRNYGEEFEKIYQAVG